MNKENELDNQLRDLLGCTCSYNRSYDGNSWNNKHQKYENCSCVETLPQIQSLINKQTTEAYKKGYVKGGIDEIIRHDKATQNLLKDLDEPNRKSEDTLNTEIKGKGV